MCEPRRPHTRLLATAWVLPSREWVLPSTSVANSHLLNTHPLPVKIASCIAAQDVSARTEHPKRAGHELVVSYAGLFRDSVQFCSGLVDLVICVGHHLCGGHRPTRAGQRFVSRLAEDVAQVGDRSGGFGVPR